MDETRTGTLDQKCAYAAMLHFNSKCMEQGVPLQFEDGEYRALYAQGAKALYAAAKEKAGSAGIAYPMDGYRSVEPGTDEWIHLQACCTAAGVTVAALLNALAVPA